MCVMGGAICVVFQASTWVGNALFIALGVSGVIIAFVSPLGILREENRVRSAKAGRRATYDVTVAPRRWVVAARLLILVCGILGLPLLIAGLIAGLTSVAIAGAVLVGLFFADTGLVYPAWQIRRSRTNHD